MIKCMAGDFQYSEAQRKFWQDNFIAFGDMTGDPCDGLIVRTKHRNREVPEEFRDAADMVSMMMCQ